MKNPCRSHFRYEGELFPAIYWVKEPETLYLASGSAILTGAKSLCRVEHVWREFMRELKKICKEIMFEET